MLKHLTLIIIILCLLTGCSIHNITFKNADLIAKFDFSSLSILQMNFAEQREIKIENFTNLILEGDFIAVFHQSDELSIVGKSLKKNNLKYIRHKHHENTLTIKRKERMINWGFSWLVSDNIDIVFRDINYVPLIQIHIYAPDIEMITLSKESKLLFLPEVTLDKLTLNVNKASSLNLLNVEINNLAINSSGHDAEMEIHLSGMVNNLTITKKCSGTIFGNDLSVQNAKIRTTNGFININSINNLEAHTTRLGRIRVYNEPQNVNITSRANRVRFN